MDSHTLTRRRFLQTAGAGMAALAAPRLAEAATAPRLAEAATAPRRPNIVVILGDDMGFSDIGCYGGEIRTPNLDRLAAGGVRFTQFYNTARCCPTRACLLTGVYPHQAAVGHMTSDQKLDGYQGDLSHHCVTLAEVLHGAGYGTYAAGKWHVTRNTRAGGPRENWPLQRGFDRYYGTLIGAGSFWDPGALTRDNTPISPFADPEYRPGRYYYTDAISDQASRFIAEHSAATPDRPFFLYTAFTAAHWPMHAPEEEIARYRGRYDAGYEPIRRRRLERLREMGILRRGWEMSPQAREWDAVPDRAWEARCMEVYAAMVDRMDQGIGRIVETLRRSGQLENTLLLYLQDNGGCAEETGRQGNAQRADKPSLPPIPPGEVNPSGRPKQTRDGYPVLPGRGVMPGPADTFIAYGQGWANVSNTPFREYKHYVHEGGIATPLIAHWPEGIRRRGDLEHQPGHLTDVMATCVDVAGARYPMEYQGRAILPTEGRSLVPALAGKPVEREALFWEHEGNRALRVGKWKLVAKGAAGKWELYDLERDRTEMHDLAEQEPARAKAMAAQWEAWARRTHAWPWPWKAGGAAAGADAGSTATTFELKPGDVLTQEQSPRAAGRAVRISALLARAGDGVILSQGGSNHGYALYVQEGRLAFALRRAKDLTVVQAPAPLAGGEIAVAATLAKDGAITLRVGDAVVATGKAPGPLTTMPTEGVTVGDDPAGRVGPYAAGCRFGGAIRSARIELGP